MVNLEDVDLPLRLGRYLDLTMSGSGQTVTDNGFTLNENNGVDKDRDSVTVRESTLSRPFPRVSGPQVLSLVTEESASEVQGRYRVGPVLTGRASATNKPYAAS